MIVTSAQALKSKTSYCLGSDNISTPVPWYNASTNGCEEALFVGLRYTIYPLDWPSLPRLKILRLYKIVYACECDN
jgi:hypothetical protein